MVISFLSDFESSNLVSVVLFVLLIVNEDVDLLNLINLKKLSSNFSYFINTTFMFNSILKNLNIDFFHNYVLYPGTITFFKKFYVLYLFGYNIR